MLTRSGLALALVVACQASSAQDQDRLVGTWKLLAFETELQATGERRPVLGQKPNGYLVFTPQGRVMVLITGEGRKAAENDQERAALLRSMFAYSGLYKLEGDRLLAKIDVSWNEAWNGTEQVRFFKLEGNRLSIISAWAPSALLPGQPVVRAITTFERDLAGR